MSMFVTDHSINRILGLDNHSDGPPQKRQRRNRTVFSDVTIDLLEKAFSDNKYPDIKERMALAKQIGEEEARVQVWFQNRRARQRRSKRPRIKSDGTSSNSSSSPKSSPSPPPVILLRPTWLQQKEEKSDQTVNAGDTFYLSSPSLKDLMQRPPNLISPLPKTPTQYQTQRHQHQQWSQLASMSFLGFTNSPLPTTHTSILRLPLTSTSSCSMSDLSKSEGRSADNKLFCNYPASI